MVGVAFICCTDRVFCNNILQIKVSINENKPTEISGICSWLLL